MDKKVARFPIASPLAVRAPQLGRASETFIRRHMCDLLPGKTAVVVGRRWPDPLWAVDETTKLLIESENVGASFQSEFRGHWRGWASTGIGVKQPAVIF